MMQAHRSLTDTQFEAQFETGILPEEFFTHEAHIRLGWIHINKYGLDKAIANITTQLKAYTQALGADNKYNHTVTIAALKAIAHFVRRFPTGNFEEFIHTCPRLNMHFRELMAAHYQTDIFSSALAKSVYLEPELLAFD